MRIFIPSFVISLSILLLDNTCFAQQQINAESKADDFFDIAKGDASKPADMCFVGSEVADENLNNRNGAFLLLCPSLMSTCDGSVREWVFHSGADDNTPAYLGFFRRSTNHSLQLVGFNRVRGTHLGRYSKTIAKEEQINILKNDFIGVFYDQIMSDYSVVAYQRYARTFSAARNKKLQQCFATNYTYAEIMRRHGRIDNFDDLDAEPTLISLQAAVDRHPMFSCFAGYDPRAFTTMRSPTWLALMPASSFPCSGRIIRWEFLSVAAAIHTIPVYLSVWRFATNMTYTSPQTKRQILQRVAFQHILVGNNGFMVLEGDDLYEVYVQKGDFLGIYFEAPNLDSGIPIMTDMMTEPDESVFSPTTTTIELPATDPSIWQHNHNDSAIETINSPNEDPFNVNTLMNDQPADATTGPEMDWCILSKTYREKIDNAMDYGTLTLYDFKVRKCAAAIRAFVKDFTLTDCGMPPNVDNAVQKGTSSYETSVVSYECLKGYIMTGDPTVTCQSNGLWTSPPDCVESFEKSGISPCFYPPAVEHADVHVNSMRRKYLKDENENATETFVAPGSVFAQYTCKTGFIMIGKPEVECTIDGAWGERPKCQPIKHECKAGKVVQKGGDSKEASLMAFTKLRFTCSGEIHTWEYYSNSSDGEVVYFDVWRKIDNGHYKLVGRNEFPAMKIGRVIQPVEVKDRVRVAAGDFIGIHYVSNKAKPVIPTFNTRNAGELARLLGDTFVLEMNDATLAAQTKANHGYLDLRRLGRNTLRIPPVIAYANALPGCGLPTEVAHGEYVAMDTNQGSVATYNCNTGYGIHGSANVYCRSPNMWTNPPVCLPLELCRTGPVLYNNSLANAASFLNIFRSMSFPCAGVIAEWDFYSLIPTGVVYFSVWRTVADKSFELVGFNRVEVNGTGLQKYYVRGDERITVLQNYYVGIHYDDPLMPQSEVVVPHADDTRPFPYKAKELYDGWAFQLGHEELLKMDGRIELMASGFGLNLHWRIPAVNPVVRRALVSCGIPPVVQDSSLMGRETTQLAIRTYKCDTGFFLVGNPNITCRQSGRWTEPPMCVKGCTWGKAIPEKEFNRMSQKNALSIFVSKPLGCRGFIKSWTFFSIEEEPADIYFDIWRRNGTQQMYLLVGSNRVMTSGYGLQTISIGVEQQIFAEAGDVVGFHYDIMTPPIIAEAEPEDHAYHPDDMYDVLEEMDYGVITPGTTFILSPIKIRKAAKLPSLSVQILNYQSQPYGLCEPDTTCPQNAECISKDGRHMVCMCSSGFWLRFDGKRCLPAAGIGEPCDESVACESQVMACTDQGTCECIPGWTPSADGKRCKPVSPNPDFRYSVHGEPCGNDALCYHSFRDQECRDGICQCRRGFRWASEFEKRANPENLEECRPMNNSLHMLPELAELCYIDQRAYYERARRSQQNQFALSTGDVEVKTLSISGGGGDMRFGSSIVQLDSRGDVMRAAIISALSMFLACAVMFAVWSWNSRQGIYPFERNIGNRLQHLITARRSGSSFSSGPAWTSIRQSLHRSAMFQRFNNPNISISTVNRMMDQSSRHELINANRSISQCSLNLNEADSLQSQNQQRSVSGSCLTEVGNFDDLSFEPSTSSVPKKQPNSSMSNQFGEPTPGRADTLTLLSTSKQFLQENGNTVNSAIANENQNDSIQASRNLTDTMYSLGERSSSEV